ncbi:hypothetical protein ACFV1L_05900 [Kitasatospora sp. NPDC059646]|uniref:hypothetical protein n=1 Tax=Kitasatospora sp. NPDC059646 TaxID=3346893 RepID=UPI0036778C0F
MTIELPWYATLVFKLGRPVVLVAALLMSIPGEVHLAAVAGWDSVQVGDWTFNVAGLMPVCVSVYAACSAVIADVAKRLKLPGRKSALAGAAVALALALAAQGISHLIELNYLGSGWILVLAVSAIPPLVAAHMLHMAAAPVALASHVEPEEDTESDELLAGDSEPGPRRTGKRGGRARAREEAAVLAAAEQLRAAGTKVTGATLGKALGVSRRSGTRYCQSLPPELRAG